MDLEFWYEFASSYSYPAAMRIEKLAAASNVTVRWRPFLLGPIFAEQGLTDSPFNVYPAKGRYMWRDLERICQREDLALRRPDVFPQNGLRAARIAVVGQTQDWGPAFTRAVYGANFAQGRNISDEGVLRDTLRDLGLDAAEILAQSQTQAAKDALRQQTEQVKKRGLFGAPSFLVGKELFWGNDRMEEAMDWARSGK